MRHMRGEDRCERTNAGWGNGRIMQAKELEILSSTSGHRLDFDDAPQTIVSTQMKTHSPTSDPASPPQRRPRNSANRA